MGSAAVADEEEDHGRDRRDAIACADVGELEVLEPFGSVFLEHCEIHIQGHGETLCRVSYLVHNYSGEKKNRIPTNKASAGMNLERKAKISIIVC